ncbi:MAG: mercury(II) reductase [Actinobacteria bacterium]|nr:mercury(II) reductase [Actinomycetota bacterium]
MAKVEIPVGGMTCEHCETAVAAAGATDAQADFRRGRATAELDGDPGVLAEPIGRAGYTPGQIETAPDRGTASRGDGGYELAIVGSGGAAFGAAIRATNLGARVVLVERATVGGTCVNTGCVPSKTLLAGAAARHTAASHPFAGLPTQPGPADMGALVAQKDELVGQLRQAKYAEIAEAYGFEILHGEARFVDADTLEVNGRALRARSYLVATGAEPKVPDLPGLVQAGYLTSTTAMELTEVPGRVVTIGGGFVGLEQSQLLARLGAEVTVVGRLAPRVEPELAAWLGRVFADEGITVVDQRAVAVERDGADTVVVCADGTRLSAGAVLVAVGRSPRVGDLNLDAAGVKLDDAGFVAVDEELRTSSPRVFAAGDVTGAPQYVYVAAAQGNLAAENALDGAHRRMDYTGLPSVIFTDPALASAGLTEADAKAAGYEVAFRVLELENVPRALANRDTRGAIKLVADAATGKVLGVHALAEGAGDVILAAVYAIKFGLTVDDLANTWAPYLTMSEGLKLVAQSFKGDVKKLSCCAA